MKLVKSLDRKTMPVAMDSINQIILKELVTQELAVTDLTAKLNLPTLNVWRRMQKLLKAELIEQTQTKKVGNIEKKLYRAVAAWYAPQQLFTFKPKDANLKEAFEIYQNIQNNMMAVLATYNEIPKDSDPVDYSLFINMEVFADVCCKPEVQQKIVKLKETLSKFHQQNPTSAF